MYNRQPLIQITNEALMDNPKNLRLYKISLFVYKKGLLHTII